MALTNYAVSRLLGPSLSPFSLTLTRPTWVERSLSFSITLVLNVFLWWYQPETMGRSYEELDEMFAKRIPARKFKGYVTEAGWGTQQV
jgi:hypothetical protein